jgi:hypothetical protein
MANAMKTRRKRLDEQVEGCRRALAAGGPAQSVWVESLGRALRLLGDPEATPYLRRAAEMEARFRGYAGLLRLGNLYRLAGDEGASRRHLERAYQDLKSEREAIGYDCGTRQSYLQEVCLLLGRDAEAEAIGEWLASFTGRGDNTLPLIARSRRTGDPEPARRAVASLGRRIRDSERPFAAGAPVTDWDWYELAVEAAGRSNKPAPEEVGNASASTWSSRMATSPDVRATSPTRSCSCPGSRVCGFPFGFASLSRTLGFAGATSVAWICGAPTCAEPIFRDRACGKQT